MHRVLRLAVLAAAALTALAVAGSALAAYTPRLIVNHTNQRTQGGGTTTLSIVQSREDQATFRVAFYVPQGYTGVLNQPAGTQIGTVSALVQLNAISPETIPTLTGTIKTDNPATYNTQPQSVACAGAANFNAVWVIELTASGQTLRVPAYVFVISSGPEQAFAQYKIVACLPNPNIPATSGGATFGAKPLQVSLRLTNVFTTPTAAGNYRWRAIFTPWPNGAGAPDVANTVESQSVVRLSGQLTANLKVTSKKRRSIRISGTLSEYTSQIAGATIRLFIGNASKAAFTAKTNARGKYTFALRKRSGKVSRTTFRAQAVVPNRSTTCADPLPTSLVPRGCVSATLGGFTIFSKTVSVRI